MSNLFYRTYLFLSKYKAGSIIAIILLLFSLLFVASKIQFEEDISKLIPSNDSNVEMQRVLKSVNFTDKIVVNIKRQSNGNVSDLTQYAATFLDSINSVAANYISSIQGKVDDDDIGATLDFVYENIPVFLDESDYKTISEKLKKDSIDAITQANYRTLLSPTGIIAKKTILKDPLGISFIGLKKLQQLGVGDDFILKDGFLLSKDENNVLLFITPKYGSSETAQNEAFAAMLYSIQHQLNEEYSSKVESEYFGAALIAVANAQQIKRDIQFTVGIALTILILIFIFFYRKISVPLILFTPTVFGGLLSVACLYLIRTQISAISLGIGSVLLGVTLDYSLHILTHIRNNHGIEALYRDIAKPILMSSLTTALAFLCLLFLNSQALQDLGIFAAISVLGASVFALLFIPLVYKGGNQQQVKSTFLDRLAAFNFHKNKIAIGGIAALILLSLFTYGYVGFDKDISKLNYEPPAATKAKENLDALTNISSKSVYIAVYDETVEAALRKNDHIYRKLQELEKKATVISYSSIGALVSSEEIQKEKINTWNNYWDPETLQNTKNNLIESGAALGFKPKTFESFYSYLETDFTPLKIEDYKDISTFTIDDHITSRPDYTTVTSLVKTDAENVQEVKDVFNSFPNTLVIDRQQMNETLLGHLKTDFNNLIGYSLLVVLVILLVFYRSLSLTIVTALPIFLTWFITIGVMGLLQIQFNIFNIIISTFIFGLGIDYSIFMTNGLLKTYRTGEQDIATHKTSIILSVITTILGVGVLIFAKHPALYSISVVSIIGILSAMLVAFTVQPLLFKLFIGSRSKRPISLRLLIHSALSFSYYGLGGFGLSIFSVVIMPLIPLSKKVKMRGFHRVISKFMKSVLYSNPFVKKRIINAGNETFEKPGIIIANHTSFLDILAIGMLHPKIIFLVNDWVYNSPVFGKAVQLAGFYPVSGGIEKGVEHLKVKVAQGYSLMAFPEGTRSTTNKIRRFHKGAFFLAEQLNLDIIPVLIHGNSEVLPKGSFVIRDGSITLKILNRITNTDQKFGNTYKDRTKKIGRKFRDEFALLRSEIEGATYFHSLVKNDFKFKGNDLFGKVRANLKQYREDYKMALDTVAKNGSITTIDIGHGELEFLLLLDSADRRINAYISSEKTREIVENSFITNHYNRIIFANSEKQALELPADWLVVKTTNSTIKTESDYFGLEIVCENENLIIFKKKGIS
tara:strand:- start:11802 stop:15422 length:3621 start_codon:yes stop_codon:yes gene_type:complete